MLEREDEFCCEVSSISNKEWLGNNKTSKGSSDFHEFKKNKLNKKIISFLKN